MRSEVRGGLVLAGILAFALQAAAYEPGLLDLPLFPVPIVGRDLPVTEALSRIGLSVRDGYVLFGIELRLQDDKEPTVTINVKPGSALRDALQQVFQGLPRYTFQLVSSHLIEVYPLDAKRNRDDLLNVRVARFDVVQAQPGDILSDPQRFIPELKAHLTRPTMPGQPRGVGGVLTSSVGPAVTLHLRDVTIRQILNAASVATEGFPANLAPLGWLCTFKADPSLPAGGAYSWSAVFSAPHDWKKQP